jgi:hypothetical protein
MIKIKILTERQAKYWSKPKNRISGRAFLNTGSFLILQRPLF